MGVSQRSPLVRRRAENIRMVFEEADVQQGLVREEGDVLREKPRWRVGDDIIRYGDVDGGFGVDVKVENLLGSQRSWVVFILRHCAASLMGGWCDDL